MRTKILFIAVFAMATLFASAQSVIVTGTVTDAEDGELLAGVTVMAKGTTRGTVTDISGKYSIYVSEKDILAFSYIGYETQLITVGSKRVINVKLSPSQNALSELVVMDRAIVSEDRVSSKEISSALQGKAAGMQISNANRIRYAAPPVLVNSYEIGDSEEYGSFSENKFILASSEALSTFSVDVDGASYTNFRRFINQGQLPPKDAIRIEEFINYFSYDYEQPTDRNPVRITTEVGECPWNKQHRLVRVGVKAKEIASNDLPASNFVFLIDVSGSMYGTTRLELVKSSMKLLINNLREKDRVAIVVYAGRAGEVLPSTSGADKQKIREALDNLTSGGSTAGGAGIKLAYEIAKKNFIKGGNNRIILCTDGDFNVGVSSNQSLEDLVAEERKSGVFLSVLGYGMGNYKDSKMQTLAEKGNGNAAYIDNLQEANKILVNEFGSTMYTVAKDVKLQIEFNPAKVQAYRLVGYESRLLNKEDFNDDTKDAGEMGAGHTVTAFYEVVPVGVENSYVGSVDDLKYQKANKITVQYTNSSELLTVKLRYKLPTEAKSTKIDLALVDKGGNNVNTDFKFAAAVAMFAQIMKNSSFKGNASLDDVIHLAKSNYGDDKQGYRREFVRLAETAKGMKSL